MLEALLMLVAGLLGWLLARRQQPTAPPDPQQTHPDNRRTPPDPPKFEDRIDEIAKPTDYPDSDDDLAAWLDEHTSKRK